MPLSDDLKRWVAADIIDTGTAAEIEAFEAGRSGSGRIGRGMEAIAYLGAVLVLVALGILAGEFWDRIDPWAQLSLSGAVAMVLLAAGWALGKSDEPAVNRAQTLAWLLAVAAIALTAFVAFDELAGLDETVFLLVSLVSLVAAVLLWWRRASMLQIAAVWLTAMATIVASISLIDDPVEWSFGLAFAGLGLVWLLLTWGGALQPRRTSYALGAVSTLLIAFPEGNEMPWPLLGLAVGLALMGVSVAINEAVLLGLGVAGLFVYIPLTIFELFGESLGVPIALLITGLVLLGVVVATVRLRRETEPETKHL